MTECFSKYYRVLNPNRWMVVEFHNSKKFKDVVQEEEDSSKLVGLDRIMMRCGSSQDRKSNFMRVAIVAFPNGARCFMLWELSKSIEEDDKRRISLLAMRILSYVLWEERGS